MTRRGERSGCNAEGRRPSVEITLPRDPQRRLVGCSHVSGRNRAAKLQMSKLIAQLDAGIWHRQAADEREPGLTALIRISQLPVRMATGIAFEVQNRPLHDEPLDPEGMAAARP